MDKKQSSDKKKEDIEDTPKEEQEIIDTEEQPQDEDSQEEKPESKEDIERKYNELNDKYIRVYSDFENTKKRLEKDKYSAIDYAVEKFAQDLLEVLDNLTLALKAGENKDIKSEDMLKNLTEGIDLTFKKFEKVLEKYSIVKIDTSIEFDPNIHNAISQVESDQHKSNEIVEVFQEGYKLKDRVLRASMVSIAK